MQGIMTIAKAGRLIEPPFVSAYGLGEGSLGR